MYKFVGQELKIVPIVIKDFKLETLNFMLNSVWKINKKRKKINLHSNNRTLTKF